jgi:DNA helicase IV
MRLPKLSNLQVSTISSILEIEAKNKQWDALLIDEAQDVSPIMWERIELLAVVESGKLYAFMDSNQSIYRPPEDLSTQLKAMPFELNLNLRNTRSIARATEALYSGPLIFAYGAEGEKPICIEIASFDEALEKCVSVVRELTTENNVNLGEITILVRDKSTKEKVQFRFQKSGLPSTGAPSPSYNILCIETVPQFKGLESNIVIALCDYELGNSIEMSYVSLSRARSRFYLIGNVDRTKFKNALIQD